MLYLSLLAESAVTTDKVVDWTIKAPLTVAFFALLFGLGWFLRWLVQTAFPRYLDEQEKSRQLRVDENEKTRLHLEKALDSRGKEAANDVADAHTRIGTKVDAVHVAVADMSGKVDKVDAKISGVHALIRAMASKQGVVVLLLVAIAAATYTTSRVVAASAHTCDPKCKAPSYCCQKDVCCRNASTVADCTAASPPHSDRLVLYDYGNDPWSEQESQRTTL